MRFINNLSISTKLVFLGAISGGVALVLCCLGFMILDVNSFRMTKTQEIRTQAEMLAFNSTAVLTFHDAEAANQLLSSLSKQPTVELGCLYDIDGNLLAKYSQKGNGLQRHNLPSTLELKSHNFTEDGHLELTQLVLDKGEVVGTLYLLANMDELNSQLWGYAKISAMMMLCSLCVSIVLSAGLQRTISRPILEMENIATRITQEGDYSVRVKSKIGAELGNLSLAFNRMLSKIETTKQALKEANNHLEVRVRRRTIELEKEVSHRQAAQANLENSRDAAETANRAKSEFLANMSHEIRTPLNGILGFSELLMTGGNSIDESERLDYIKTISSSGKHLLDLINDILDLSKIEADKLEIERVFCPLQNIVNEVLSVLRVKAGEKGISLESEWRGETPKKIQTDPARLRQLLTNLIGNAIKFTESGSVRIVTEFNHDSENPRVIFKVIDSGVGIPEDKLDAIFDPFIQADNSVTRKFGGTGLGLAISRRIANALGGDLTVESKFGSGSTFTAVIDAGDVENIEMLSAGSAESIKKPKDCQKLDNRELRLPPLEILLVEDGETNRKLFSLILRRAGAIVTQAENGQIGLNLAIEGNFDLVLMDMQMPVMDGYTASARLREHGATLPIIALTAHAMKGDEEKCLAAGCSGFLTKPIESTQFLKTIREAVPEYLTEQTKNSSALETTLPMDDPEFREIVIEFLEGLQSKLLEMKAACKANDMKKLGFLAHWLKGTGGAAGFEPLTKLAARLEQFTLRDERNAAKATLSEIKDLVSQIAAPKLAN